MTPEQFAYWLQGCLETTEGNKLSEKQVQIVRDHLATVFKKVTPVYEPKASSTAGALQDALVGRGWPGASIC
jgi:hypothetical protein